jgi:hypothetical protein
MPNDVSIDVGSMYPYLEDRVLSLFGKDTASTEWKQTVQRLVRTSLEESSHVQCVGMAKPIPIECIYQPTSLIRPTGPRLPTKAKSEMILRPTTEQLLLKEDHEGIHDGNHRTIWTNPCYYTGFEEEVDFSAFLDEGTDAVILAGPGWGKTTLLHWMHQQLIKSNAFVPILFTLRRPEVFEQLEQFVRNLESGRKVAERSPVLLVDGYDEVNPDQRQRVSAALMRFRSLQTGRFFLTCRTFYDIYDLKAIHCRLGPFRVNHARQFISSFSTAYGIPIDGSNLLRELRDHGLEDFYSHPLMLALVCILRTGPNPTIPRRAIGLIRRAIDTLTFRWDEAKYVKRHSQVPLDGEERMRCLMRIAYDMKTLQASWALVEKSISNQINLLQIKAFDKRLLMREIAQWYGLVVPLEDDSWQFVHRTIHDFLAARFWVEGGTFRGVEKGRWDNRAAYAACLVPDATSHMLDMLRSPNGHQAFIECLYNGASFNMLRVAESVIDRVSRGTCELTALSTRSVARIFEDFFGLASDDFLRVLVEAGSKRKGQREANAQKIGELVRSLRSMRCRSCFSDLKHSLTLA